MWKCAIVFFFICFYSLYALAAAVKEKEPVDWWCDETDCYYSDTIPMEEKCDSNHSIPYRFNYTTGLCELNLKELLLSFRVINNRLSKMAQEKSRKRTELIFQGITICGNLFVAFASVCACVACLYCCWVKYTDHRLRKSVKEVAKKLQASRLNKPKSSETRKERNEGVSKIREAIIMPEGVQISAVCET